MANKLIKSIDDVAAMRERIIALESELKCLKNDPKWKSSLNYLRVAEYNGIIDEAPSKQNGYRIPEIY